LTSNSQFISRIQVERLFGHFTYDLHGEDADLSKLLILYGGPLTTRLPRAKPRGHFLKPHRRTLPCLPQVPNSLSMYWPVLRPVEVKPNSLPPRLQLRPPCNHPPSTLHPLPPSVMLSVAKHLNPSLPPNPLHRLRELLSPLALNKVEGTTLQPPSNLPNMAQTGMPPGSTGAAKSPQTAISFRINTYKTISQLLILNRLHQH
jgi:hypothetical protein